MADDTSNEDIIKINGKSYYFGSLSPAAQAQVANIKFCDAQVRQLQNELAIADTARLAYTSALGNEDRSSKGAG